MAKRLRHGELFPNTPDSPPERNSPIPNAQAYVYRLFSALESNWLGSSQEHAGGSLVMNATLYPVFVGGLEVEFLKVNPQWEDKLRKYFQDSRELYHDHSSKNA